MGSSMSMIRKGVLAFSTKGMRKTQADIKGTSKAMGDLGKQTATASKEGKKQQGVLGGIGLNMKTMAKAAGVAAAAYGVLHAGMKAMQWAGEAAKVRDLERAFGNLTSAAGKDADAYLASMAKAAQGTISSAELMRHANYSMLLGLDVNMADLLKIARATSQATGQTVDYMTKSLVVGIGRQSRLWLDNLGIIISVDDAQARYAASLGKTAKALSEAEKKQAFTNEAIRQGLEIVRRAGGGEAAADPFARLSASSKDLADAMKDKLVPALGAVADKLAGINREWADYLNGEREPPAERPGERHRRRQGAPVQRRYDYTTSFAGVAGESQTREEFDAEREAKRFAYYAVRAMRELARSQRPPRVGEGGFNVPDGIETPGGFDIGGVSGKIDVPAGVAVLSEEDQEAQLVWLDRLAAGMHQSRSAAAEMGAGFMAMGEAVNFAGQAGAEGMGLFIDATVAAARGSKAAYAEMAKAVLKWAATTMTGMAKTAAGKALFYKAEAFALLSNPLTASLAPQAAAAAATYASMAAYAGAAAIGLGLMSAANAPSGTYYSQDQKDSMTGLSAAGGSGSRDRNLSVTRTAPTTINVIYNNYGTQNYNSEARATADSILEAMDYSGEVQ